MDRHRITKIHMIMMRSYVSELMISEIVFFFFNDTATTEIYTLSLHDALPIYQGSYDLSYLRCIPNTVVMAPADENECRRSEEHTSELQSQSNLVCRLLLEKKKNCGFDLQRISLAAPCTPRVLIERYPALVARR